MKKNLIKISHNNIDQEILIKIFNINPHSPNIPSWYRDQYLKKKLIENVIVWFQISADHHLHFI